MPTEEYSDYSSPPRAAGYSEFLPLFWYNKAMDLETLGDKFRIAEEEADASHWDACEIAYQAWLTGRPEWAWILAQFSGKSDDQVRNRRNAFVMFLELLSEIEAEPLRESLSFSHFSIGYKFLSDTYSLVDAFKQAVEERMSVRFFGAFLADLYGDDPASRFVARYGRFKKELAYILGMAESNRMPEEEQTALRALLAFWKGI